MTIARPAVLLAAALCLGLAAPAPAQEASPVTAADATGEAITIPFAPPLDTPIAYRLRFERKRATGDSAMEFDQRLTFVRAEGGYALTVETLSFNSEGRRIDLSDKRMLDILPPALKVYLMPMVAELDEAGEMVRMRNWPAMQESLRGMPDAVAAMTGRPVDEAALAAVKSVLDPFLNASAEEAPALMIRGWPAVLGYGGAEFVSGELIRGYTEVDTPFAPMPIPAVSQGSVTRSGDGRIMLTQTTLIDPEVLRALTLALIEQVKARAPTRGTSRLAEEISSLSITDEVAIAMDRVTGLPVTARIERITSADMPTGAMVNGEITTITRIEP
jgi:hypothetical protein